MLHFQSVHHGVRYCEYTNWVLLVNQQSKYISSTPLVSGIKEILNVTKSFEKALPTLSKLISDEFDGQWVGYWAIDEKKSVLKLSHFWHSDKVHADLFEDDVSKRTVFPGEGMPGKVWRLRTTACSCDLVKDMMLPKSLKAEAVGFKSGLWFPVYSGDHVYGVFEVLKLAKAAIDNETTTLLNIFGEELGNYIATNSF